MLPQSRAEEARGYAERIRSGLRERNGDWGPVTVSAGVAEYEGGMSSADILVAAADRALYKAKEEGRDRVVLASELTPIPRHHNPVFGRRATAEASPPPAKAPGEKPAVAPSEPPSDPTRWQGTESILVVDDDDDARHSISRVLNRLGYTVYQHGDPRQAITFYQSHGGEIDLILTDVVMPAMNGMTLVDQLTRTDPEIRVLYLSGYILGEVSWSGVPGSVTGFLEKPITIAELGRAVRTILDADA